MNFTDYPRYINMNQTAEINVTGHGSVSAMPDSIQIDLSVISQKPDYPQTLGHLNGRVAAIVGAVARAGIDENVVTKSYAISEVWSDQYDEEKRRFQGYKASQMMAVTIPLDMGLLGCVVKELAKSESKPGMGITFVIRDMAVLEKGARTAAATKAKEAAQDLAEAAGLQLLSVKTITFKPEKKFDASELLHMETLAQFDTGPSASMTPDAISHIETVHMVWLAAAKD
jgi:uncharacterized protein